MPVSSLVSVVIVVAIVFIVLLILALGMEHYKPSLLMNRSR